MGRLAKSSTTRLPPAVFVMMQLDVAMSNRITEADCANSGIVASSNSDDMVWDKANKKTKLTCAFDDEITLDFRNS